MTTSTERQKVGKKRKEEGRKERKEKEKSATERILSRNFFLRCRLEKLTHSCTFKKKTK